MSCVRQRQRPAVGRAWRRRHSCRHEGRRGLRSITPRRRRKSHASSTRKQEARLRLRRCAGSGGQAGAENGVLTVMCGGDEKAYGAAETGDRSLRAHVQAARPCRLRPADQDGQPDLHRRIGAGALRRHPLRAEAGLDVNAVIETISKGAAQSWQMENRYKTMNEGKFRFWLRCRMDRKDLSICLAEARRKRRELAGHRPRRQLLCGSAEDGRQPLGHLEPVRSAGALILSCRSGRSHGRLLYCLVAAAVTETTTKTSATAGEPGCTPPPPPNIGFEPPNIGFERSKPPPFPPPLPNSFVRTGSAAS